LLPDGPDWAKRRALAGFRELRQSATRQLWELLHASSEVRESDASCDFLVPVTLGDQDGSSICLQRCRLIRERSRWPSTNRRGIATAFGACAEIDIGATAALADSRFARLESDGALHCLRFLHAVRREVVDAIGGAG